MMAAEAMLCLYLQYTVETTTVRVVPYDAAWVGAAFGLGSPAGGGGIVGELWRRYYRNGLAPTADFGSELDGYKGFLGLTKAGCERDRCIGPQPNRNSWLFE